MTKKEEKKEKTLEDKPLWGLITQSGCGHCSDAKIKLYRELISGKIKELPVENPKWFQLATKHRIQGTPQLIKMSKLDSDAKIEKCSLDSYLKNGKCDNEEE